MNTIGEQMESIRADNTSGAGQLTRRALETLQAAVTKLPVTSPENYRGALIELAHQIAVLRPNMHSLRYYMNCFVEQFNGYPADPDLPTAALELIDKLVRQWEEANERLTVAGARLIKSGSTLLTASYSSAVIRSLTQAHIDGKNFDLFIARSQTNPLLPAYGCNMEQELTGRGILSHLVNDAETADFIGKCDMVLLGADSVLADGSVVNGYPSGAIARQAARANVPVYILCEASKRSGESSVDAEPGFDLIPAELITAVINGSRV